MLTSLTEMLTSSTFRGENLAALSSSPLLLPPAFLARSNVSSPSVPVLPLFRAASCRAKVSRKAYSVPPSASSDQKNPENTANSNTGTPSRRGLLIGGTATGIVSVVCPLCGVDPIRGGEKSGLALASEWGYGDLSGPPLWGNVCRVGQAQSPINIPMNSKLIREVSSDGGKEVNSSASGVEGKGGVNSSGEVNTDGEVNSLEVNNDAADVNSDPSVQSEAAMNSDSDISSDASTDNQTKPNSSVNSNFEMTSNPVSGNELIADADLGVLRFKYDVAPAKYLNTGHGTMQVNFPPGSNKCIVDGRELELLQFHFHAPSEHAFNGVRSAMEAHLVHKDDNGRLAVIGVMLESVPTAPRNICLEAALTFAPKEKTAEVPPPVECIPPPPPPGAADGAPVSTASSSPSECFSLSLSPASLLPPPDRKDGTHTYIHYKGSLTTPPCSEGVDWFVMANPLEVPDSQVLEFLRYVGDGSTLRFNSRPVQDVGDRNIYLRL